MKKLLFLPAFLAAFSLLAAPVVEIDFDDAKDYAVNDTLTFKIRVTDEGAPVSCGKLGVVEYSESTGMPFEFKSELALSETGEAEYVTRLDRPGFVRIEVSLKDPEDADKVLARAVCGAQAEAAKVVRNSERPADFDEFWDGQLARLAEVPVEVISKVEVPISDPELICYDVQVKCVDGVPVSGYLTMPRNAEPGTLPAVVTYHGAGVYSAFQMVRYAKAGAIAFDINAHGVKNGQPQEYYNNLDRGELAGYYVRGKNDREKCYFLDMFLRVRRSLDYVKTLPEWDGKNLFAGGGSQGGAQAIVAAALDSDVNFTAPQAPWLCNFEGRLDGRNYPGWPDLYTPDENNRPNDPATADAMRYFDMVNLAGRIGDNCEVYMTLGLIDPTCLPSGIMAAYNAMPTKNKSYAIFPKDNHGGPHLYEAGGNRLVEKIKSVTQHK